MASLTLMVQTDTLPEVGGQEFPKFQVLKFMINMIFSRLVIIRKPMLMFEVEPTELHILHPFQMLVNKGYCLK